MNISDIVGAVAGLLNVCLFILWNVNLPLRQLQGFKSCELAIVWKKTGFSGGFKQLNSLITSFTKPEKNHKMKNTLTKVILL